MNEKVYKTLEFDKILEKASKYGVLDITKEAIKNIKKNAPKTDLENARLKLSETDSAMKSIIMQGSAPIYNFGELSDVVKRLEIGGSLNPNELIRTATLFKSARLMKGYIKDGSLKELSGYEEMLYPNKYFEDEIFSKIISDEEIHDNASNELFSIRRKKESTLIGVVAALSR